MGGNLAKQKSVFRGYKLKNNTALEALEPEICLLLTTQVIVLTSSLSKY